MRASGGAIGLQRRNFDMWHDSKEDINGFSCAPAAKLAACASADAHTGLLTGFARAIFFNSSCVFHLFFRWTLVTSTSTSSNNTTITTTSTQSHAHPHAAHHITIEPRTAVCVQHVCVQHVGACVAGCCWCRLDNQEEDCWPDDPIFMKKKNSGFGVKNGESSSVAFEHGLQFKILVLLKEVNR